MEIKEEIGKYLETNEIKSMTIQNLWAVAKAVLRRKIITIKSYLRKQENSRIDNINLHLKQLEEEQTKPKVVEGKKS